MAERRGLTAAYPFPVSPGAAYRPRNEERFRAQIAQSNADILDRLAALEEELAAANARIAALEGAGP
jgi:hypothetical protein